MTETKQTADDGDGPMKEVTGNITFHIGTEVPAEADEHEILESIGQALSVEGNENGRIIEQTDKEILMVCGPDDDTWSDYDET